MDLRKFRSTLAQHPLAYMSAEFALDDHLPIYAGGLGVLAGDIVRQANDMNLPFVAVGLLYKEGYFRQIVTLAGEQHEEYRRLRLEDAPIELIVNTNGERILVDVPVGQRHVWAQIWEHLEGDVSVYLLDTDIPENTAADRSITQRLYNGDRLLQEIVLGIGGVQALMKLHIHPSIFHLNESHSAFAILEITHHYMDEYGMSFHQAYQYAHQKIIFTNHTLVAAGNEIFPEKQVTELLQDYARQLDIPITEIIDDGLVTSGSDQFSLSLLALKMACRVNTVSKFHEEMAKTVWPSAAMPAITNGVHLPTWVAAELKAQAPEFDIPTMQALTAKDFWSIHTKAKSRLIDEITFQTGKQFSPDQLLITWARRIVEYKRPTLLFQDMDRLVRLATVQDQSVQIVLAGKAHPTDEGGQAYIKQMYQLCKQYHLEDRVVFLPNYNLTLAKLLVAGSDVWLNTPVRGQEACGTSGMKAGANGVLQCSVSDGWVNEVNLQDTGWVIDDTQGADHIYRLLEDQIIPLYYDRNSEQLPLAWIEQMKRMIAIIWEQFSARRMVEEYIDRLYRPALELEIKNKHEHDWRRNYRTRPA